jgi:hypothetical protein
VPTKVGVPALESDSTTELYAGFTSIPVERKWIAGAIQSLRTGTTATAPTMNRLSRALAPAVTTLCIAAGVGCDTGKRPYDTPRSRVNGNQAIALLRREVERRAPGSTFSRAEKVETQTPSGIHAWLVRLVSEGDSGDICGYVWRGEEVGRADSTVIRIQFDRGCRHWLRE